MRLLISLGLFFSTLPGINSAPCKDDNCYPRLSTPENLISNSGFETGELTPWTEYKKGTGSSFVQDNAKSTESFKFQARTGSKFLEIIPGEASTYGISQEVFLSADTTYAFDVYFSVLQYPNSQPGCEVSALIDGIVVGSRTARVGMLGGIKMPSYYNFTGTHQSLVEGPATAAIDISCPYGAWGVILGIDDIAFY